MKKFNDWFSENLKVSRFPTPQECKEMDYDVIINVSDEFIDGCMKLALEGGKRYYWFPLNECTSNMGTNSIYAALQILSNCEKEGKKAFIHCHAGANRSPMIADCYYYMRTGEHNPEIEPPQHLKEEFNKMFGKPKDFISELDGMNCLEMNCYAKHLPPLEKMEEFLKECAVGFDEDETRRGGFLVSAKLNSKVDEGLKGNPINWYKIKGNPPKTCKDVILWKKEPFDYKGDMWIRAFYQGGKWMSMDVNGGSWSFLTKKELENYEYWLDIFAPMEYLIKFYGKEKVDGYLSQNIPAEE